MLYNPNNIFNFTTNDPELNTEYNFDYSIGSGEFSYIDVASSELLEPVASTGEMGFDHLQANYFGIVSPILITLCSREYNFEYNNQCNIMGFGGESSSFDFKTQPVLNYNILICSESQLPNPNQDFEYMYDCIENYSIQYNHTGENANLTMEFVKQGRYDFDICPDKQNENPSGEFEYNDICILEFGFETNYSGESIYSSLDYTNLFIETPGKSSKELDLNNCTPTTTFDLGLCTQPLEIYGKNYQFNISLCSNETNPEPIDIIPHDFALKLPWDYLCDVLSPYGYSGETSIVTMQSGINLPVSKNYSGEVSFTNDLVLSIRFNLDNYSGEYADADVEIKPASNIDATAEVGEYADFELFRTIEFDVLDNYSGEYTDVDLLDNPPDYFDSITETGEYSDADFIVAGVLYPEYNYSGEYSDTDLTDDPLIELEAPLVETGEFAFTEILDNPSSEMKMNFLTGEYADGDELATTTTFNPIVYACEYADIEKININVTFDGIAYSGEYADNDFQNNTPDNLEADVDSGEYADSELNIQLTLFPRGITGEIADADMVIRPFEPWDWGIIETGENSYVTELFEQTEYLIATSGEIADAEISTIIAFEPLIESGEYGHVAISFTTAFDSDIESGEIGIFDTLYVTPGQMFEADGYSGEMVESDTNILHYPIFLTEKIISSQTMYDGFGGVGGLNFCPINCCDDNTGELVFDTQSYDRDPWGRCGPIDEIKITVNLTGGVRFDCDVYTGETVESYIDQKYFPFFDMIGSCDEATEEVCQPLVCENNRDIDGEYCEHDELYWLYNDHNPPYIGKTDLLEATATTGERSYTWWEAEDDYLSLMEQYFRVDLYVQSMLQPIYAGESAIISLSTEDSNWKYPFRPVGQNQVAEFTFEANEYIRFCPGYLIPEGDNVIFDFASTIFTDCFGYFGKTGESLSNIHLTIQSGAGALPVTGESVDANLTVPGPWELNVESGQIADADFSVYLAIYPIISVGESVKATIEPRAVLNYTGEAPYVAELAISLPSVKWISDGCINNVYNPLTPDGDWDYSYDSYGICIEYRPYVGKLEAVCTDEYIRYIHPLAKVMANNIKAEVGLSANKFFEVDFYSGESVIIQQYTAESGEVSECDIEVYPTIKIYPILITGDQNAIVKLSLPYIVLESNVMVGEEGICEFTTYEEIEELAKIAEIKRNINPVVLEFG